MVISRFPEIKLNKYARMEITHYICPDAGPLYILPYNNSKQANNCLIRVCLLMGTYQLLFNKIRVVPIVFYILDTPPVCCC